MKSIMQRQKYCHFLAGGGGKEEEENLNGKLWTFLLEHISQYEAVMSDLTVCSSLTERVPLQEAWSGWRTGFREVEISA